MDIIYIEKQKCSDGKHVAWIDTEDGKMYLTYRSIAECRKRWEPLAYHVVIITH